MEDEGVVSGLRGLCVLAVVEEAFGSGAGIVSVLVGEELVVAKDLVQLRFLVLIFVEKRHYLVGVLASPQVKGVCINVNDLSELYSVHLPFCLVFVIPLSRLTRWN